VNTIHLEVVLKKLLIAISLLIIPACGGENEEPVVEVGQNDGAIEDELRAIKVLYRDGDFDASAERLTALIELSPENDIAWTLLGHIRRSQGLTLSAREAYQTAATFNPLRVEALLGLGVLARLNDDLAGAMTQYERVTSLDPTNAHAHSSIAIIQTMRGRDADAVRSGERAWSIADTDPTIAANLAVVYHYDRRTTQRDEMFATALNLLGDDETNKEQLSARLQAIFDGTVNIRREE
jgi:Flp pilus assembly protein TadD